MKNVEKITDKGVQVRTMFDSIANRYDLMNRVMTFGCDQKWRQEVVAQAGCIAAGHVLDLATGTGDIAALLRKENPESTVIGGDFSAKMLERAEKRFVGKKIEWKCCDANRLPFKKETFTAVTFGYLLRNVSDVQSVLSEIFRVLKPGGRVVCLDTTPPSKNVFYPFIQGYLRFCVPLLGRLLARDPAAYSYLTNSTLHFYEAEKLADMFRKVGFQNVEYKKYMCGTVAIHCGIKNN